MCNSLNEIFCSIRLNQNKVIGFWEDVSPLLEDDEFRHFYRMNADTLRALIAFLNPERRSYQGGREQISPAKMVTITVAFLGSQMPCKQISTMFGISEGCLMKITEYVMDLLAKKSHLVIKWPSKDEYEDIAAEFNKRRIWYFLIIKFNTFIKCNSMNNSNSF